MCLKTKIIKPSIAEEDIKVYKVLRRDCTLKNEEYFTAPFYKYYKYKKGSNFPVRIVGENYGPYNSIVGTITDYSWATQCRCGEDAFVGRGWLHAYTSKNIPLEKYDFKNILVTEMIIPKGTKYYLSYDKEEICSEVLMWCE